MGLHEAHEEFFGPLRMLERTLRRRDGRRRDEAQGEQRGTQESVVAGHGNPP